MKYLQCIVMVVLISSAYTYSDWSCDPKWCAYNCCTLRTASVNDTCFEPLPADIATFNSTTDCPGRDSSTATCSPSDCTSNCCFGEACTDSGACKAVATLGLCYCLCVCAIALVPILLLVLIITCVMKKDNPGPG